MTYLINRVFNGLKRDLTLIVKTLGHLLLKLNNIMSYIYGHNYFKQSLSGMCGYSYTCLYLRGKKCSKKPHALLCGISFAMETYVTLFASIHVFARYILYVQSMCVTIVKSINTKLTKLEHIILCIRFHTNQNN